MAIRTRFAPSPTGMLQTEPRPREILGRETKLNRIARALAHIEKNS